MQITITSTTDTPAQIAAAQGETAAAAETAAPSGAPAEETAAAETAAESETAEESQDDESDSGEEEAEESEEAPKPKKKSGYQRKIDKLTHQVRSLEERLAASKPASAAETKPEAKPTGKPDAAKFETYEEYVEALAEYKLEQREAKKAEEEARRKDTEQRQQTVAKWNEREAALKGKPEFEDYDDVLESVAHIPVSRALETAILDSDFGPQLAYTLAQKPAELERLAHLSPIAVAREIGRLEAQLSAPPATPKKKTSSAPAPITPVKKGSSASTKSPDQMSFSEYKAWRENGGGR